MTTEMCFDRLPQEIKIRIFSYFRQRDLAQTIAPVCVEWWQLSHEPAFWRKIMIGNRHVYKKITIYSAYWRLLQRCQSSIHYLRIYMCRHSTHLMNAHLVYPQLRTLEIQTNTAIPALGIADLARSCPVLEEIDVSYLNGPNTIQTFLPLLTKPTLIKMVLHGTSTSLRIDQHVRVIASACPLLREFHLCMVGKVISDTGVEDLCTLRGETLTHLVLCSNRMTGASVRALNQCRKLQVLRLSECQFMKQHDLTPLLTLPALTTLHLDSVDTSKLTFKSLFGQSSGLTTLSFSYVEITDSDLSALAQNWISLQDVSITHCDCVTDQGVAALVDSGLKLRKLYVACCDTVQGNFDQHIQDKLDAIPAYQLHHSCVRYE